MLTVIFGAGASHDSNPDYPITKISNSIIDNHRPPLAKDLFSLTYANIARKYPKSLTLFPELRKAAPNIEEKLEEIFERQNTYPNAYSQFLGLRYYLHDVIKHVQSQWNNVLNDTSTYLSFLDAVNRWKFKIEKKNNLSALITFNYDTLLDFACKYILGMELSTLSSYVNSGSTYKLFKVHGSIDWSRIVTYIPQNGNSVLDNADTLKWTNDYIMGSKDFVKTIENDLIPAIAIPTTAKNSFEMPSNHIDNLSNSLLRTTTLLIVGWRASEKHFLNLWKTSTNPTTLKMIQIVNTNPETSRDIYTRLAEYGGILCKNVKYSYKGFSGFVNNDLDPFLLEATQYEY